MLISLEEKFIIRGVGHFCLLDSGMALFWLVDAEITQHVESIASLFLFVLYSASACHPKGEVPQCWDSVMELSGGGICPCGRRC